MSKFIDCCGTITVNGADIFNCSAEWFTKNECNDNCINLSCCPCITVFSIVGISLCIPCKFGSFCMDKKAIGFHVDSHGTETMYYIPRAERMKR